MQNLLIPTTDEIRSAVRVELSNFFSNFNFQTQFETDEIGGIDLAVKITGKAKATIYSRCHDRTIPHWKQGKQLYFSKNELKSWLRSGKRKMRDECAADTADCISNSKQPIQSVAV